MSEIAAVVGGAVAEAGARRLFEWRRDERADWRALRRQHADAVVPVALSERNDGMASAAARILLERKNETDWSNRQLSDSLGWSRNTVDRYRHGERAMPLDAFYRLSRLLDLDPVQVLRRAERKIAAATTPVTLTC